eukprot:scaffold140_cov565-Prasinococcus_capsulatus_cf.AAC.27
MNGWAGATTASSGDTSASGSTAEPRRECAAECHAGSTGASEGDGHGHREGGEGEQRGGHLRPAGAAQLLQLDRRRHEAADDDNKDDATRRLYVRAVRTRARSAHARGAGACALGGERSPGAEA